MGVVHFIHYLLFWTTMHNCNSILSIFIGNNLLWHNYFRIDGWMSGREHYICCGVKKKLCEIMRPTWYDKSCLFVYVNIIKKFMWLCTYMVYYILLNLLILIKHHVFLTIHLCDPCTHGINRWPLKMSLSHNRGCNSIHLTKYRRQFGNSNNQCAILKQQTNAL